MREQVVHRDRTERLGELQPRQDLVHGDVQVQPSLRRPPASRSIAANDFEIEPIWKRVSGRTGVADATSAIPRTRCRGSPPDR